MNETVEQFLSEMQAKQPVDDKLQYLLETRYDEAKKIKDCRIQSVNNMKMFLERMTNTLNTINKNGGFGKGVPFVSPIPATILETKCSSDWVPEITFEPEERYGRGSDIFLANNASRLFNYGAKVGRMNKECQKGAQDLFEKGRMIMSMGFQTKSVEYTDLDDGSAENREFQKATFIRFRNKRWEDVYWTKDEHSVFFVEDMSLAEAIDIFGDGVKNFRISEGDIFQKDYEYLDCFDEKDLRKTIQVVHYYNDTEKIYLCLIGGRENYYKKMTGSQYPFINEFGEGFIPVNFFDASSVKIDGHPISDLDKIFSICLNYDQIFQGVVHKAKKSSNSRDIIASSDPVQAKIDYLQAEADNMAGFDVPHFMKLEAGSEIFAKTLDTPFDLNSPLAIRESFIDEIMMATGVNLRLQGQGADTARQEELRMRKELETIDRNIKINESNWSEMVMNYFQMLRNAEADFYDEYIAIDDEISEMSDISADGTVRDIIGQLNGFPFNVRVSINQSNSKRKVLEISQKENALNTIAPFAQGSMAVSKMSYDIASDKFPSMKFTVEDFFPQTVSSEQAPVQPAPPSEFNPLTQ